MKAISKSDISHLIKIGNLHKNYFMNTNNWRGTIESFCGRTYVSWEDGWGVATSAWVGRPILDNILLAYIITHLFALSFLIYSF